MDKSLRDFIGICTRLFVIMISILVVISFIYRYSSLDTYNFILYFLATIIFAVTFYFVVSFVAVLLVYRKNSVGKVTARLVKGSLNILFPLVVYLSGFFRKDKDTMRGLLVKVNNILVESRVGKFRQDQIVLLLPHCLQNSSCIYKVTNDINNCRKCGQCCIGDICELAKRKGVEARVVTGGTVARSIIAKNKPKVILSVACERDLTSGICDVPSIPVIGLINDRKNGPCYNTSIDVTNLEEKLDRILRES